MQEHVLENQNQEHLSTISRLTEEERIENLQDYVNHQKITVQDRLELLYQGSPDQNHHKQLSWLSERVLPTEAMEPGPEESRAALNASKTLSDSDRRKRHSAFVQKAENEKLLQNELAEGKRHREKAAAEAAAVFRNAVASCDGEKDLRTGRFEEQAKDWAAYFGRFSDPKKKETGYLVYAYLIQAGQSEIWKACGLLFPEILHTDFSAFEFRDDKSFVTGYARKYERLKAFAGAELFLELFDGGGLVLPEGQNIYALRARIRLAMEILAAYEDKMMLIFSPYYTLVTGKEMDKLSLEDLGRLIDDSEDDQLKNYFAALRENRSSKFEKGNRADHLLRSYMEQEQKKESEEGIKALTALEKAFHNEAYFLNVLSCKTAFEAFVRLKAKKLEDGLQKPPDKAEDEEGNVPEELKEDVRRFQEGLGVLRTKVRLDTQILNQLAGYRRLWNPENPGYSEDMKKKLLTVLKAVGMLEDETSLVLRHNRKKYDDKQAEFDAFQNAHGLK